MNLTCFYCQTPFTLSMEQKIAALRKMHAENLHHYDAHCPRCGRANAISRERLEMFTPGWEEAIKEPAMQTSAPAGASAPSAQMPSATLPSPAPAVSRQPESAPVVKKKVAGPSRRRHAPAAKKVAKKAVKKAPTKKAGTKKKSAAKAKKSATKAKAKSTTRKAAKKSKRR